MRFNKLDMFTLTLMSICNEKTYIILLMINICILKLHAFYYQSIHLNFYFFHTKNIEKDRDVIRQIIKKKQLIKTKNLSQSLVVLHIQTQTWHTMPSPPTASQTLFWFRVLVNCKTVYVLKYIISSLWFVYALNGNF